MICQVTQRERKHSENSKDKRNGQTVNCWDILQWAESVSCDCRRRLAPAQLGPNRLGGLVYAPFPADGGGLVVAACLAEGWHGARVPNPENDGGFVTAIVEWHRRDQAHSESGGGLPLSKKTGG
jgi:hypothetical protein